jgi:hypothetical protein
MWFLEHSRLLSMVSRTMWKALKLQILLLKCGTHRLIRNQEWGRIKKTRTVSSLPQIGFLSELIDVIGTSWCSNRAWFIPSSQAPRPGWPSPWHASRCWLVPCFSWAWLLRDHDGFIGLPDYALIQVFFLTSYVQLASLEPGPRYAHFLRTICRVRLG